MVQLAGSCVSSVDSSGFSSREEPIGPPFPTLTCLKLGWGGQPLRNQSVALPARSTCVHVRDSPAPPAGSSPPAAARMRPCTAAARCALADLCCPSQVVYYVFAIIGMEAFQGKVRFFDPNFTTPEAQVCGNPALTGSAFARDHYCKNNFNDLASSFIVLMELTVVNQWHDILSVRGRTPRACLLPGFGGEGTERNFQEHPGHLPSSLKL